MYYLTQSLHQSCRTLALTLTGVCALCVVFVGCTPETQEDVTSDMSVFVDMGPVMVDMPVDMREDEVDEGHLPDLVSEPDTAPDMPRDDEDGVELEDDNCPEHFNPQQEDRDHDRIGDACDHYPFFYAPHNPAHVDINQESEVSLPSDDELYASANNTVSLPHVMRGRVSPPHSDATGELEGDLDFVTFEVDKPTVILVRVEPKQMRIQRSQFWPTFLLSGYGLNNANVFRVGLSHSQGNPLERELFLPAPGQYTLTMSDLTNFISHREPVGSEDWEYTLYISEMSVSELDVNDLELGAITSVPDEGKLNIHRVQVPDLRDLQLNFSMPEALSQEDTFLELVPSFSVYDPEQGRVLASSGEESIRGHEGQLDLVLRHAGARELWIVQDHVQRDPLTQEHRVMLQPQAANLGEDPESNTNPRNVRHQRLTWLEPGAKIQGFIDAPRGANQTPDKDLFLVQPQQGKALEVRVTPRTGSQLSPKICLGHAYAEKNQSSFYISHQTPVPERFESTTRTLSYVVSDKQAGEMAILLSHQLPSSEQAGQAEGGPSFGYELEVVEVEPTIEPPSVSMPVDQDVHIDEGSYTLVPFEADAGESLLVTFEHGYQQHLITRLFDAEFNTMRHTYADPMTFKAPSQGVYFIELMDVNGRGSQAEDLAHVRIESADIQPLGELPMMLRSSSLESRREEQHWRVQVPAHTPLELALNATRFVPEVHVFKESDTLELLGSTSFNELFEFDEDTTLVIKVAAHKDYDFQAGEYQIGMRSLDVDALDTLDTPSSYLLNSRNTHAPFGEVFKVGLQAQQIHIFASQDAASSMVTRLHRRSTLETLSASSMGGRLRYIPSRSEDALLFVHKHPRATVVSESLSVGAGFAYLRRIGVQDFLHQSYHNGPLSETLYLLSVDEPGALKLASTSERAYNFTWLNPHSMEPLKESGQGPVNYAVSNSADEYMFTVHPTDRNLFSYAPQVIEVLPSFMPSSLAVIEQEHNGPHAEPVLSMPALHAGTLSSYEDRADEFTLELQAGDTLYVISMADSSTSSYALDPRLVLTNNQGQTIASASYGGFGFFPSLHEVQIPETGTYSLSLELPPNHPHSIGGYMILFDVL